MKKILIITFCAILVGCSDDTSNDNATSDVIDNEDVSSVDATDSNDQPDIVEPVDTANPDESDIINVAEDVISLEDTETPADILVWEDTNDATESSEDLTLPLSS